MKSLKLKIVIKELYFIRFQHHKQQNDQISAEYGKTKQKSERKMKSTPFTELLWHENESEVLAVTRAS